MDEIFIIMQIGNEELDSVCDGAIVPAIQDAGFTPRRVDRHNTGDLLKSEIVQFIERSQLIVADLTNERPNCYLEVGYAMGLGKKTNLVLTAREDHHWSSPSFRREGPRVHFDLEGYDILFWDPENLPAFREELARRLTRRAAILRDTPRTADYLIEGVNWVPELRETAVSGLSESGFSGYMEVSAALAPAPNMTQPQLLDALRDASVHNFGWPIGVVLDNRDEYRPRPTADGIQAEVRIPAGTEVLGRSSYDFWKLFRDGRFYTLLNLHEDSHGDGFLWWDVRIARVTEALLLLNRLYRRLGGSDTDRVHVTFRHAGLLNREMRVADRLRDTRPGRRSNEDVIESRLDVSLIQLETELADCVDGVVTPLFVVFDYFELSRSILDEIIERFLTR